LRCDAACALTDRQTDRETASDGIEIVELPIVEVASVLHRGSMENITLVYDALIRWIGNSDFHLAGYSRELYHEMGAHGPSVTELQMPIAK
jgi:effector-binding domain-containing protein